MDAYAKIPIDDLTILEAADLVDDGTAYWDETMAPVIIGCRGAVSVSEYWQLTVKQHRLLVEELVRAGIVKEADGDKP